MLVTAITYVGSSGVLGSHHEPNRRGHVTAFVIALKRCCFTPLRCLTVETDVVDLVPGRCLRTNYFGFHKPTII